MQQQLDLIQLLKVTFIKKILFPKNVIYGHIKLQMNFYLSDKKY